jgi:hypothetical protein
MINEHKIIWIAGLFEGEGTISILKNKVRLAIQMTDYDVIKFVYDNFGGNVHAPKKQKSYHKKSWIWYLSKQKEVKDFLNDIIPYLFSRRKQRAIQALSVIDKQFKERSLKKEKIIKLRELVHSLHTDGINNTIIAQTLKIDRSYVSHILRGKYKY